MFRIARAAGIAAAAITLAAGVAFADPSQALEVESAPITSRYIDHAVANMDGSSFAPTAAQEPAQLAHDVDFSTPVAVHAVATLPEKPIDQDVAPRSLRALVDLHASADAANSEQTCLAQAIYFESKGEPLEGQLAVAEVVINRAESGKFPTTLCGVVKQKSQFSFVRGGRIPAAPRSSEAWRKAVAIAHIAQNDLSESTVSNAMFFHANYVRPGWRGLTRMASVGNHIFYR